MHVLVTPMRVRGVALDSQGAAPLPGGPGQRHGQLY